MSSADKEIYRRVRGALLVFLSKHDPDPVDEFVLHSLLDDVGYSITGEELRSHLDYLADATKGYIRRTEKRGGGVTVAWYRLTPRGFDLLDGFAPECDPGVDVNF